MNLVWIAVGLGALTAVVALIRRSRARGRQADMGTVSHQWISEHRLSQTQDSRR
jgi:uncharacterized membrane protein